MSYVLKILYGIFLIANFINPAFCQTEYNFSLYSRSNQLGEYSRENKTKTFSDSVSIIKHLEVKLEDFYENGFIAAGYDSISFKKKNEVYAWLTLGEKYLFNELHIQDDTLNLSKKIKINKNSNKALGLSKLLNYRRLIVVYYENSGFPFCQVWFDDINFEQDKLTAKIRLDKGEMYIFDSIILKGDSKTHEKFIEPYLNWSKSSLYSEKYLKGLNQNLSELEFVEQGKPFELAFRNGKTDVLLYLKDRGASNFSGILGIMPNNNITGKLVLTGDVDLMLKNVIGRGEHFAFNWKKYEAASQQLNISMGYPFIFNTSVGAGLDFMMEKQDSSYLNTDVKIQINYFLDGFDGLGVFYQNASSFTLSNNSDSSINDLQANLWGLSYNSQKLDYIFNPRKGYKISLSIAGGVKNYSISTDFNNVEESTLQARAELYTQLFIPVFNRFAIKLIEQAAYIYDQNLYANELYRIGGFRNFRGVDELSLKASAYSVSSIELRYLFERNSAVYLFSDLAWVQNKTVDPIYSDFPYSFGLGLDLFTNAGIFSLNYGVASLNNNPLDFRSAKVHIGYKNRF
jgi:outer membrane protein assembly factor BamA